jgi:molybdopterin synthase sulfur carrier subunit
LSVTVLYFASLRDAAGVASETLPQPASLRELYASLKLRHALPFAAESLRVAVDGAFCGWDAPVGEGAEIAFIPPVSGG